MYPFGPQFSDSGEFDRLRPAPFEVESHSFDDGHELGRV